MDLACVTSLSYGHKKASFLTSLSASHPISIFVLFLLALFKLNLQVFKTCILKDHNFQLFVSFPLLFAPSVFRLTLEFPSHVLFTLFLFQQNQYANGDLSEIKVPFSFFLILAIQLIVYIYPLFFWILAFKKLLFKYFDSFLLFFLTLTFHSWVAFLRVL